MAAFSSLVVGHGGVLWGTGAEHGGILWGSDTPSIGHITCDIEVWRWLLALALAWWPSWRMDGSIPWDQEVRETRREKGIEEDMCFFPFL
jgi:hypothetical protein